MAPVPVRLSDVAPEDKSFIPRSGEPEGAPPLHTDQIHPGEQDWTVSPNLVELSGTLEVVKDPGVVRFEDIDLDVTRRAHERYSFTDRDFNSVRGETHWIMDFARRDWQVEIRTKTVLSSTPKEYHVYAELDAYEGQRRGASKTWDSRIPRDHT
ncbi:hypothetical protein [Nesterenkonia haasae]|uniref:hypothetical protein n=1 Tax=Nesterenkonia haasae TaxID=2587813 RepID=UPI00192E799F|nr:hypothetical protein [Nesterenkonia haasae]